MAESGIRCPDCGALGTQIVNSRPSEDGARRRRRHVCPNGHRFSTIEVSVADMDALLDIKSRYLTVVQLLGGKS